MKYRHAHAVPDSPEPWDFSKHPAADLVIINLGTSTSSKANQSLPRLILMF